MRWWQVSRWQAFVAGLLMALSFLTVWLGENISYTLTNYTVHAPGESVTVDGVTYTYLGMARSQVVQGSSSPTPANPGMTWVLVVVEVVASEPSAYCPVGVTSADQTMSWSGDQSTLMHPDVRFSCFDITEADKKYTVGVLLEVPTRHAENLGGVVIDPNQWRKMAQVIR